MLPFAPRSLASIDFFLQTDGERVSLTASRFPPEATSATALPHRLPSLGVQKNLTAVGDSAA